MPNVITCRHCCSRIWKTSRGAWLANIPKVSVTFCPLSPGKLHQP